MKKNCLSTPQAVLENRDRLAADYLVIFDGPLHRLNKPTLTFGARGIFTVELTTYGPIVPQHSGHFGNYVPNPAFKLAKLLASMKDDDGRVLIPGYYDGIVLDNKTKTLLKATPHNEEQLQEIIQVGHFDRVAPNYQEAIQYPSLNVRGMQSGWINEKVRTIIPAWAKAEIDVRIVKESDPERLSKLIKTHIENQGYVVIDREPTKEERLAHPKLATYTSEISYQSFRTPMESPIGVWLQKALVRAFDEEPIRIRMSGGSIPISPFVNTLNLPAVTVPTVNRDNNQHSPNENLRLGNYRDGIKTILAILTENYESNHFFTNGFNGFFLFGQATFDHEVYEENGRSLPYRILLPNDFQANKKYPLLVFLHGAGERGEDNKLQLTHGSALFLNDAFRKNTLQLSFSHNALKMLIGQLSFPEKDHSVCFSEKPKETPNSILWKGCYECFKKNIVSIKTTVRWWSIYGAMGTFELVYRNPENLPLLLPFAVGPIRKSPKNFVALFGGLITVRLMKLYPFNSLKTWLLP